MTGPEQHAATVREAWQPQYGATPEETLALEQAAIIRAEAALDELVALAGRADELEAAVEAGLLVPLDASAVRLKAAEARADELERNLRLAHSSADRYADAAADSLNKMHARAVAAEARADELQRERDEARRESEWQMGSKIEAQTTLRAITEALDLRFDQLGIGWKEAAPKILARIETIVDEAERGFTERDQARREADQLRAALEDVRKTFPFSAAGLIGHKALRIIDAALDGGDGGGA